MAGVGDDGAWRMRAMGDRRDLIRTSLAVIGLGGGLAAALPSEAEARGHRQRRRKRCRHRCKSSRKTCDRACDILDGDSRDLCKQGCRVAMSQCRGEC